MYDFKFYQAYMGVQTQLVCCMGMHNKVSTPMIIDLNDFAVNLNDFAYRIFGRILQIGTWTSSYCT